MRQRLQAEISYVKAEEESILSHPKGASVGRIVTTTTQTDGIYACKTGEF